MMKKRMIALSALCMALILSSCAPFWTGAVLSEGIAYAMSPYETTTTTTSSSNVTTGEPSAAASKQQTTAVTASKNQKTTTAATTTTTTKKVAPVQTTKKIVTTKKTAAPPSVGTQSNPIKLGQTAVIDNMNDSYDPYKIQITITEIIRGQKAEDIVMEGNPFNDPAPGSMEYMLIKVKIKLLDSGNYRSYYITKFDFEAVSQKGVTYDTSTFVSGLDPALTGTIYIGEETEGYFPQLIMKGDTPKIVFTGFSDREIWFATK